MTTRTCSKTDIPNERDFHFCGMPPNHTGEHRCGYGMCTYHWPELSYIVVLTNGIKLGVLHSTRKDAEATAKRLRFRYYEVIPYRVTKNA